jgi:2-polyprenyl-6-methoxyphenol hydroxylase-like FAD-dependent oxidoreductase
MNLKLSLIELNVTMGLFSYYWNRVGLKAVVLEQSDKLRVEGTTITLWNNAMKVMELFNIADQLRNAYVNTTGTEYLNYLGKRLTIMDFSTCEGG